MDFGAILQSINPWAVFVSAAAGFVLGGVWYGALVAKPWARFHGYTMEEAKELGKNPARTFSFMAISEMLIALGIAAVAALAGISGLVPGLLLGLILWVGIAGPIGFAQTAAHNKPLGAFAVDQGYELLQLVVMGVIIGVWR